jgi:hypothetical protein
MVDKHKKFVNESHDLFTSAHDELVRKASFYLPDPSAGRIRQMLVSVDRDILTADAQRDSGKGKDLENTMIQVGIKAFALVLALRGVATADDND